MGKKGKHKIDHERRKGHKRPKAAAHETTLKEELENEMQRHYNEMARTGYLRTFRKARTPIISMGYIEKLFSRSAHPTLRLSLEADMDSFRNGIDAWLFETTNIDDLETHVRTKACRLYAILQLAGQPHLIVPLYKGDHLVTDEIFEKSESKNGMPYCSKNYLSMQPLLSEHADEIYKCQWYIPPVLGQSFVPTFPVDDFRFPFITKPEYIDKGGSSGVFKVSIARGHLKAPGYDGGSVVAYKQVAKRDLPDLKQTKEISIIRARPHANIVKIFAGFFAGRENPWDERGIDVEEDLHMLFEHTDRGNMKTWLELTAAPRHLESTAARRSHIQETIESLVEAVMCIHKDIKTHVAFHHDLKPANILLFLTPSPLWKICDFGMANLKHGDKSETSHHDGKGIGTYMYQPPEYFQPGQASGHGRPFDIWSLGCIILELLTVWHFGWARAPAAGIEALRDGLAKNTELAVAHRMKTNQSATADASFHNNFNVVKQWIVRLREEGAQDTVFIKILDLVSEMLVEDKNKRIFIWEVHMDLYEMANEQTKFKLTEADLQDYYRNHVVQPSRKSLAAISNNHNPLTRAKKLKKGWQVEVLGNSKNKWHDGEPEQTEELKIKRHSTGINYSTLKDCPQTHEFDRTDFYGRHDIDLKISEGFRELNCVGLYGLSGIGKSHMAYHYVVRFRDTDQQAHKKHTFWVEAGTMTRLEETVNHIARRICPHVTTPEQMIEELQRWLADEKNGPWIMVIDGLDNKAVAEQIERLLPKNSGQVLVTTKDRTILDSLSHVSSKQRKKACLHMGDLAMNDSRLVFQWYNDDFLPTDSGIDKLLKSVPSPALIKLLARYAANNNKSAAEVHGEICKARIHGKSLKIPEAVYKCLTQGYHMFEALGTTRSGAIPSNSILSPWPSQEFLLLCCLACLNKGDISFELIAQDYSEDSKLGELLGSLENCSFVAKSHLQSYCMHEIVQDLARRWVIDNMGLPSLLDVHQTALCMLVLLYNKQRDTQSEHHKTRRSSYHWKLRFMPHFERFLGFAKEFSSRLDDLATSNFKCSDNMVNSVITFSQTYMEEGRYEDAICVLEFVHRLYKGISLRLQLARHLCKAYTISPLATQRDSIRSRTTELLETAAKESMAQPVEHRNRQQEWLCLLDLIYLHCKFAQPEKAFKVLKDLKELRLIKKGNVFKLHILSQKKFEKLGHDGRIRLAVHRRVAEGRIHVATGDLAKDSTKIKHYQCAREAFSHAVSAIQDGFDDEGKWISEVNEELANVLCKMSDSKSIKDAIAIYKLLIDNLEREIGTTSPLWRRTRLWGWKCRKADAQLRLGDATSKEETEECFEIMRQTLAHCEERFGKPEGKHDEHTLACADFIMEAYERCGRTQEARNIRKRYSLTRKHHSGIVEVDDSSDFLSRRCISVGFFFFILAILALQRASGHRD